MSERQFDSWDEDEQRRREQAAMAAILGGDAGGVKSPSNNPTSGAPTSSTAYAPMGANGIGTPQSGYGAGGVNNPAYTGPGGAAGGSSSNAPRTGAPTSGTLNRPPGTIPTAATSSANAPRLTQANGGWTLNEHGNQRHLQANEVGDAQQYVSDFWGKFPTGFQPDNPNSLNDAYRQFTGREGDAAGIAAHQRNPGGFAGAINTIAGSDEAKAYAGRPPTTITNTFSAPVTPPRTGGFLGSQNFDLTREQNPAKSAKDAFALLASQAPPPPIHDKAQLAAWFAQYIKPGMDERGHAVSSVDGDKFTYGNHEGNFAVDFGRSAGAPGGDLWWGAEPADDATRQRYATSGASAANDPSPSASFSAVPFGIPSRSRTATDDEDPMARVQAEIDALINGRSTPMEEEELRRLLQG